MPGSAAFGSRRLLLPAALALAGPAAERQDEPQPAGQRRRDQRDGSNRGSVVQQVGDEPRAATMATARKAVPVMVIRFARRSSRSLSSAGTRTALAPLAIALPQLLEPAAILRLAGLFFDLLDKLLTLRASREVFDEPGE
jgi:hypothetical protein